MDVVRVARRRVFSLGEKVIYVSSVVSADVAFFKGSSLLDNVSVDRDTPEKYSGMQTLVST